jgi:hypothetical protein
VDEGVWGNNKGNTRGVLKKRGSKVRMREREREERKRESSEQEGVRVV